MPDTMRSMRSGWIGRLRSATSTERDSFSRSNGTRRPERLTTMISRSCTRSKVVKRPPQSSQLRRRRMDCVLLGRTAVLDLGVLAAAVGAAHVQLSLSVAGRAEVRRDPTQAAAPSLGSSRSTDTRTHSRVDRETARQSAIASALTFGLDLGVAGLAVGGQAVQHLGHQAADLRNSATPKPRVVPAGEPMRMPDVTVRLLRIERHAVLVGGDVGAPQRLLGDVAGQLLGPQVDQQQVRVGAAGDEIVAGARSAPRPAPWHSRPRRAHRP